MHTAARQHFVGKRIGMGGKGSISGKGGHHPARSMIGRSSFRGNARKRDGKYIEAQWSVCKVMHGHEYGLNRAEEDASSVMLVRPVCVCTCVAGYLRAISRISQYITGGARARGCGPGFYLALLLLPLRRYVARRCCDTEARTRAKDAAHCSRRFNRYSLSGLGSLPGGLPTECPISSDIWEFPCP